MVIKCHLCEEEIQGSPTILGGEDKFHGPCAIVQVQRIHLNDVYEVLQVAMDLNELLSEKDVRDVMQFRADSEDERIRLEAVGFRVFRELRSRREANAHN